MEHHDSLWTELLHAAGLHAPDELVMATLAALLLTVLAVVGGRRLSVERPGTLQQLLELGVGGVVRLLEDIIPHHARRHLPMLGTFFAFILTCNLFGLVPSLTPATQSVNVTFGLALMSFTYYNAVAVREVGAGPHLKHLAGPIKFSGWMLVAGIPFMALMFGIELIGHFARNLSLSMRLFGNIFGEHTATGVFQTFLGGFLVPLPMMFMGLFAAFLQAFIFSLLSMIYIALATEH